MKLVEITVQYGATTRAFHVGRRCYGTDGEVVGVVTKVGDYPEGFSVYIGKQNAQTREHESEIVVSRNMVVSQLWIAEQK